MDDKLGKQIIFYLGSLHTFTLQTREDHVMGRPPDGVYWADAGSPQGYGPFQNLFQCMEHYAWLTKGSKANLKLLSPMTAPLIRVDFKTKKRVDSDVP